MKLSEIQTNPVPQAQGWEQTEQAAVRAGEEKAYAFQQGGKLAGEISQQAMEAQNTITRVQLQNADAKVKIADAQLKNDLENKKSYSWQEVSDAFGGDDNIPSSISSQFPKDSGNIPGFVVNRELYAKRRQEIVDKASEGVQVSGWRDQFKRQGAQEAQVDIAKQTQEYQKEADHYEIANLANNIDQATNAGDFVSPVKWVQENPRLSPEQKLTTIQNIKKAEGEYGMQVPMRGTDRVEIQSTIAGLESGNNKFTVTMDDGRTRDVDVSAISTDQRREKTRMLRQYLHQLDRGDKQAQKDYYDKNDKDLIVSFTQAGATAGLGGMLAVQRQMFQHPGLYSESAFKYVAGAIESRSNIAHTREKTEDPTTVPNQAHANVVTTLANDPDGHLVGPDGKDWGPVKEVNLQDYSTKYKVPPPQLQELQRQQTAARQDKTDPNDTWATKTINRYLDANEATADTSTEAARNIRAEYQVVIPRMLKQLDEQRVATGEKKMTRAEREEAIQTFIEQSPSGTKVQEPGRFFGTNKVEPRRADDMEPNELIDAFDFAKSYAARNHDALPFDTSSSAKILEFDRKAKQLDSTLQNLDAFKNISPKVRMNTARDIQTQRTFIEEKLKEQGISRPSTKDVVRYYYNKKYPGQDMGLGPEASLAAPPGQGPKQ